MSLIAVDENLCKRDGVCIAVCPSRTLVAGADGIPQEDPARTCILCGHCVAVCHFAALTHSQLPLEAFSPMPAQLPAPAALEGLLRSRRSIRAFKEKPVSRALLEELLSTARMAPTATNSQQLHWIAVNGREKVRELAAETVEALRLAGVNPAQLKQWEDGYDFVLRGAPTLVVVCAPQEYRWRQEDGAIALTFLELAAEARGLGACWAGYLTRAASRHEPIHRLLCAPAGYAVCGGLMLGESKFKYRRVPPRKPLSAQWIGFD
jgi:nitroreductase/NAD-dependent dihydropyrimidine dehydrogenase PreA subunit